MLFAVDEPAIRYVLEEAMRSHDDQILPGTGRGESIDADHLHCSASKEVGLARAITDYPKPESVYAVGFNVLSLDHGEFDTPSRHGKDRMLKHLPHLHHPGKAKVECGGLQTEELTRR